MDRRKKERIKSCILAVLVLTSILQVGILWGYRNHGFPISLLQAFSRKNPISQQEMDDLAREEFFVPFRVVIYPGDGEFRSVLGRRDEFFSILWKEGRYYLQEALKSTNLQQMERARWNSLVNRRSVIFEMKNELPVGLVEWFLDIGTDNRNGINGVHKIMLSPGESFYRELNTVYILSDSGLFRTEVVYPAEGMNHSFHYYELMNQIENSENTERYKIFGTTGYPYSIPADTLSSFSGLKKMKLLSYGIPEQVKNTEQLTGILLDEYRESYDRSVIDNGTCVFQTLNKMFRVYVQNGLLEYRYTGLTKQMERGDAGSAFSFAYRFINPKKNGLLPNAQLYLHSVEAEVSCYRFEFGYRADDYPVFINEDNRLINAVVVKANSRRVVYCNWILRDIAFDRTTAEYNNNFLTLLDGMKSIHGINPDELLSSDEGYVLFDNGGSGLEPVWIVGTRNGSLYSVPMNREGAD